MSVINSVISVKRVKLRDTVLSIIITLYILLIYTPMGIFPKVLGSVVLDLFLGITVFNLITKHTPLIITHHSVWLFCFGILGLFSSLYAIDPDYVFKYLYILFVSLVVSFSFIQYVQNDSGFKRLFSYFAYFPIFLVIYLFLSGEINVQSERLGQKLFGNANALAVFLMITLFCIAWLIIYGKRKYLLINIILAFLILYITALTGGRKYLLIPLIYFLLLLIFKNWRNNKPGMFLYIVLFALVFSFGTWAVINVPIFYNSVGVRFEGLFNFLNGDLSNTDSSTMVRYLMISNGWELFLKEPILGYGLNNFSVMFAQILGEGYAHNNYIELMVDLGMIGIIVYYSFYAFIIGKLICIRNDITGLRNFFLAYMLVLLVFEIGNVTYQYLPVQILIGLASAYVWLYERKRIVAI